MKEEQQKALQNYTKLNWIESNWIDPKTNNTKHIGAVRRETEDGHCIALHYISYDLSLILNLISSVYMECVLCLFCIVCISLYDMIIFAFRFDMASHFLCFIFFHASSTLPICTYVHRLAIESTRKSALTVKPMK